jgi:hypothetical protein
MRWVYDDGGRWDAGYRPRHVGDCVVRAIAIATEKPYDEVHKALGKPRLYHPYLTSLGWGHIPIAGRKIRLSPESLPPGRLVVEISRHLVAVIDGVIHDTYLPSNRHCLRGYFARHIVGEGFCLVEEEGIGRL